MKKGRGKWNVKNKSLFFISLNTFLFLYLLCLSSVQFSHSVVLNSLQPHELQHVRLPCPLWTPRVHPNPCPLNRWCHPTISSSIVHFSSCPQSFPASGSFPMSQLFASGGQNIEVSASTYQSFQWKPRTDLL